MRLTAVPLVAEVSAVISGVTEPGGIDAGATGAWVKVFVIRRTV